MPGSASQREKIIELAMIWAGWILGPTAWGIHLMVSYLLVEWVCRTGDDWALHGVTLFTLILALFGAWLSWRRWSLAGRAWPGNDAQSRPRFLAVSGVIIGVLSALIILAEGIPTFFLDACL